MQITITDDSPYRAARRLALSQHPQQIGLDYIEVLPNTDGADATEWQLRLHFVPPADSARHKRPTPAVIQPENIRISAGSGALALDMGVVRIEVPADSSLSPVVTLALHISEGAGQVIARQANYLLALVDLQSLDPFFATASFALDGGMISERDPSPGELLPFLPPTDAAINYLARDYASFRQLMLDRLSLLMPSWNEGHASDQGIMLVELLAYVADHLSYYQDAVATEAYLGTARRRVSVRRHARLLDYPMHEGCNARVWVHVEVNARQVTLDKGTRLLTRLNAPAVIACADAAPLMAQRPQVFETMHVAELYKAHNQLCFYTWGAGEAVLPAGATRATLRDDQGQLQLKAGDVLIFEQVYDPLTGAAIDAEAEQCQAVRLIEVRKSEDALGGLLLGQDNKSLPLVEIVWAATDALRQPLPLAATIDGRLIDAISVAYGNIVLADHGDSVVEELPPVPAAGRYRPQLTQSGLTYGTPYADAVARVQPAAMALDQDARAAIPLVTLHEQSQPREPALSAIPLQALHTPAWIPRADLLSSDRFARVFVVESESDGTAVLRFGDGRHGRCPASGMWLTAHYRIGGGTLGNIGRGALAHVISDNQDIVRVRNPLAAQGGSAPEAIEQVRLAAPYVFRQQERCVTADDYAAAATRHPEVGRAAAELRWTGSWYTALVTVTRRDGRPLDDRLRAELRVWLQRFRPAGYDVEILAPRFVPLDILLQVRTTPDVFRSVVRQALREIFDARHPAGFFHPDHFDFGQPVYLSQVITAALKAPGVLRIDLDERTTRFQRWGRPPQGELQEGQISLGALEIARLDNDPALPQNGTIGFILEGGR